MENCASSEFLNQWLVGEEDCHNWLKLRVSPSLELNHWPNPHRCQGVGQQVVVRGVGVLRKSE